MKMVRHWYQSIRAHVRLRTIACVLIAGVLAAVAAPPGWWAARHATNSNPQDDYAPLNQGQLKNLVRAAAQELRGKLPGGAGAVLTAKVASWTAPTATTDDFAAVNIGQLKAAAALVYDRFKEAGYVTEYPWDNSAFPPDTVYPRDDFAMANIGQAKNLFAFDLATRTFSAYRSPGGDGIAYQWKIRHGLDPNNPNLANEIAPGGITYRQKYQLVLDPTKADTDGDGNSDGDEIAGGSDAKNAADTLGRSAVEVALFSGVSKATAAIGGGTGLGTFHEVMPTTPIDDTGGTSFTVDDPENPGQTIVIPDGLNEEKLGQYNAIVALPGTKPLPEDQEEGAAWKTDWVDATEELVDVNGNTFRHGHWSGTYHSLTEDYDLGVSVETGVYVRNDRLGSLPPSPPPPLPPENVTQFAGKLKASGEYTFTDLEGGEHGTGVQTTSTAFTQDVRNAWLAIETASLDEATRKLYGEYSWIGGFHPFLRSPPYTATSGEYGNRIAFWIQTNNGKLAGLDITRTYLKVIKEISSTQNPTPVPATQIVQLTIQKGNTTSTVESLVAPPGKTVTLLPVEILIPEVLKGEDGYYRETPGKLVNTTKLAIGTLENSFKSTTEPLKDDWIEADPDRFYIRISNPAWAGKGVIKVRVWTQGVNFDNPDERIANAYKDDDRSTPESEVIDLIETGNLGEFKSKSMLLTSNDGDDQQPVDGFADNAKNDRTRKIELGGKLKVELLEGKQAPTYQADIEAQVPIEKTVKVTVFVAKKGNGDTVATEAEVGVDFRVLRETMAQVGVKVVRNDPVGDNSYMVKFKPSDAGVSLTWGLEWAIPAGTTDAAKLLNWIDQQYPRQAGEIRCIYVNYLKNWNRGGLTFRDADFQATPKHAGTIWIEMESKTTYVPPHELMHVLLNAEHDDYQIDFANKRTTWRNFYFEEGIYGSKRIHKRSRGVDIGGKLKTQKDVMISSPYAK